MSNMSYCRFHNTLSDLQDCYEAWQEKLSEDENTARARLLELCQQIADEFSDKEISR